MFHAINQQLARLRRQILEIGLAHDNAIAAAGFRHYGLDEEAVRVADGIFDAAQRFAGCRLPELRHR